MKFIIKLFPEITIKSQSVRLRFIKILTGNIRNVLKNYDETLAVVRHWDHIEVRAKDENQRPAIRDALTRIPGIHHILEVEDVPYTSLHDIFEQTLPLWRDALEGKTFCVRVKRRGKHEFTSIEVERYVGGGLNQHIETARVKLTDPDVTVNLEIENDRLLLVKGRYEGIGGFPIGTQEDVLSLISGGFDSGVSSYMLMRRGCRVHYCFFNLGGAARHILTGSASHMAIAVIAVTPSKAPGTKRNFCPRDVGISDNGSAIATDPGICRSQQVDRRVSLPQLDQIDLVGHRH